MQRCVCCLEGRIATTPFGIDWFFETAPVPLFATVEDAVEAVVGLYGERWNIEVDLRSLKGELRLEQLTCTSVEMVAKEIDVAMLAYNLVRSVMGESARLQGVDPDRIGLVDAVRWLIGIEEGDLSVLVVNPSRRGRVEPRAKKRRPKQYSLMSKPRSDLRKLLPLKNF